MASNAVPLRLAQEINLHKEAASTILQRTVGAIPPRGMTPDELLEMDYYLSRARAATQKFDRLSFRRKLEEPVAQAINNAKHNGRLMRSLNRNLSVLKHVAEDAATSSEVAKYERRSRKSWERYEDMNNKFLDASDEMMSSSSRVDETGPVPGPAVYGQMMDTGKRDLLDSMLTAYVGSGTDVADTMIEAINTPGGSWNQIPIANRCPPVPVAPTPNT